MKKKFNIMLCTLIGVLSACNEYDFDQEQYRNEVGLLSNSSLIYDRQVANVGQEKDTIYLVATVSGSQISPNTHHVALLESDSLLKAYNKSNFDIEKEKFAKLLPDECYDFPNKELDIQAGTSKVMFPIYLKNLIFGKNGYEADLQKTLAIIGERLADDVGRLGAGEENPMWYYLKGCCICNTEGYPAAVGNFRKAAEMGVIMAWADVAVACSHNAEGVLVDKDAFIKAAEYGMSKRDALCRYFCAVFATDGYDDMDLHRQQCAREKFTAEIGRASCRERV